jgi:hypothetical protein
VDNSIAKTVVRWVMIEKKGEGDTEYGKTVKCNREQPDRVDAGRFFAENFYEKGAVELSACI